MKVNNRVVSRACLNGRNVALALNGNRMGASFEPFYWIKNGSVQDGFPSEYASVSKYGQTDWTVNTTITDMQACGYDANCVVLGTTIAVDTKGAKFLDVTPKDGHPIVNAHGSCTVIGVKDGVETQIPVYQSNAWVINANIPIGDYDSIKLKTQCSHWATNWCYFGIYSIYFHN